MRPERASARPSLASMQTAVMALITGRDAGAVVPDADALIVSDARASADERVHVYAHMYRARIVEALESQFPRLAKLLGPDDFAELAVAYISDEPSRHPSLRYVGERLPAWLAARRPESPTLASLATLEWARADVFDLADEPVLTVDELRARPAEKFGELPLQLVSAHRIVTIARGTAVLWELLSTDVVNTLGESATGGAEEGHESLVIWREGTIVYHRVIDELERQALELVGRGAHFGILCELLIPYQSEEEAVRQAYSWMSTWLADGLLSSVSAHSLA